MRLFEVLSLLALLPYLVWPLLPVRQPRWLPFLPLTAVALTLIHLLIEGYRWQMLPGYVLIAVCAVLALLELARGGGGPAPTRKRRVWTGAALLAGLLVWLLALVLPWALPVPQLPKPTGPYAIGTQTYHLIDAEREEIYTDASGNPREIMVQIWYPAAPDANGPRAPYLDNLDIKAATLAARFDFPSFLFNHVNLIRTDAIIDAPFAPDLDDAPIVVFSHGLQGIRGQNTTMMQALASHGYVVAAIDHTHANAITVFPDGRVVLYNPDVFAGTGSPPRNANTLVGVWAEDMGFVIDELARRAADPESLLHGRINPTNVGIFGHSTGGGASVEACVRDERCRAGLGLDAWVEPVSDSVVDAGLARPFLFLKAPVWQFDDPLSNPARTRRLFEAAQSDAYLLTLAGTGHFDFSDVPLLSPLTEQLGLSGSIDSARSLEIQNAFLLAFFDTYLKGAPEALQQLAARYPEVEFEAR